MSGPKISIYELNGWAKSIVFGQIRCEQQCLICAERIKDMLNQASSYRLQLESLASASELMASRGVEPAISKGQLIELTKKLEDGCNSLRNQLEAHYPQISAKYTISDAALEKKKAEFALLKSLQKQATELRNEMDATVFSGEKGKAQASEQIEMSIAEDLSEFVDFSDIEIVCDKTPEITLDDLKKAAEQKLTALLKHQGVSADLEVEIKQAMLALNRVGNVDNMKTFNEVTVTALERKIEECSKKEEALRAEYAEDVSRFLALCSMLEREETPAAYSREAAASLKEDIERMELALVQQQEQIYISECVDEVMTEMGYDLIGTRDVKKRSGKKFRNELFTFNEGTAVNVTYSSDGQISMELGGLSREDRLPTDEETDVLTKDMETFCDEFEEFERRLRAKGIVLGNRIALSPPSAEYATIINVSDYDVDASKQVTEINTGEKRRNRANEKKVLRRDE